MSRIQGIDARTDLRPKQHDAADRVRRRSAKPRLPEAAGHGRSRIIGDSPAIRAVLDEVERAARAHIPVLLTGESGTGKTAFARLLHELSPRRDGPLVCLNCATIPGELFESELFGHERGAFTGAVRRQQGKVARARGGTLFLDEIGEMPLAVQPKLLHFLDTGYYEPVGGEHPERAEVRIIAATNRDVDAMVSNGEFREDLLYRINAVEIFVPPLRDRRADLPMLVQHFIEEGESMGLRAPEGFSREAWEAIGEYPFPGNIRQLRNLVQHIMVAAYGTEVRLDHLPARVRGTRSASHSSAAAGGASGGVPEVLGLREAVAAFEIQHIRRVLALMGNHRSQAARALGISRKSLWTKLKRRETAARSEPPAPIHATAADSMASMMAPEKSAEK